MDTQYEELLKSLQRQGASPYATAIAQTQVPVREVEMRRSLYEANARQQQLDYERVLRNQANTLAQKLQQGAVSAPAFSNGVALTEDGLIKGIDKIWEEKEKAEKMVEDKKKRQKNANTLEKLLRHEFQKTEA